MKTIEKKVVAAEHRISKLKSMALRIKSLEGYIASRDNTDIAERNIQVAIEACLDIGKIIIGNKGLPEPADNKGVFSVLAEAGIITKESLMIKWVRPSLPQIEYKPGGLTFVKNWVGSTEKAEEEIGFKAKVQLREVLKLLIQWRDSHKAEVEKRRKKLKAESSKGVKAKCKADNLD